MLNIIFNFRTLHTETVIWCQIASMLLCILCLGQRKFSFVTRLWKYICNMVKMKIIAGRTEAEYGEGIPSGATRFKWYRVGKCSFIIFKNTLVDNSLLNYTEGNMN